MQFCTDVNDGPVMSDAKKDLEGGEAQSVLLRIPEKPENILKNLPEIACCEQRIKNDAHDQDADWYLGTIRCLTSDYHGLHRPNISTKASEENKLFCLAETAGESGIFEEPAPAVQDAPAREIRQRFSDVMEKRKYGVDTGAAGRGYVSAFADFTAFLQNPRAWSFRVWT